MKYGHKSDLKCSGARNSTTVVALHFTLKFSPSLKHLKTKNFNQQKIFSHNKNLAKQGRAHIEELKRFSCKKVKIY